MIDSWTSSGEAPAIRGWLLLLCLLLLAWQPANLALVASGTLDALPIRGLPFALVLATRVLAAGIGIAAGIALLGHAGAAVALAKVALTASAAADLLVYLTPYSPSNRMPGDTPIYVVATLVYYAGWMSYLVRSRRVRETFR